MADSDKQRSRKGQWLIGGLAVLALMGLASYWYYSLIYPSTDDAYLQAHRVEIRPRINGLITEVLVTDHQAVEAGEVLMRLDSQPWQLASAKAYANYQLALAEAAGGSAAVKAALDRVDESTAALQQAQLRNQRLQRLVAQGTIAQAEADNARLALRQAKARQAEAQQASQQVQKQQGIQGGAAARLVAARTQWQQAQLQLSYTEIKAPAAGRISRLTLQPGDWAQEGQSLFFIIEGHAWWVDANFKESDLARITAGQPATITLSMDHQIFTGRVESIAPASGASFALLPAQNASGNWVKVTQRFPVRIALDPKQAVPFRMGASANVTVDTTAQPTQSSTTSTP